MFMAISCALQQLHLVNLHSRYYQGENGPQFKRFIAIVLNVTHSSVLRSALILHMGIGTKTIDYTGQ